MKLKVKLFLVCVNDSFSISSLSKLVLSKTLSLSKRLLVTMAFISKRDDDSNDFELIITKKLVFL